MRNPRSHKPRRGATWPLKSLTIWRRAGLSEFGGDPPLQNRQVEKPLRHTRPAARPHRQFPFEHHPGGRKVVISAG